MAQDRAVRVRPADDTTGKAPPINASGAAARTLWAKLSGNAMRSAYIFVAVAAMTMPWGAAAQRRANGGAVNSPADIMASSRMSTLQAAVAGGDAGAVGRFWDEMRARGTPLVEPVASDVHSSTVTFLWRGKPDVDNVVVVGGVAGTDVSQNAMEHIEGTDVWYRVFRVRNDARFAYSFSANDSPAERDPLNPRVLPGRATTSYLELPEAPLQPWITRLPGVAAGRVTRLTVRSTTLKNSRDVWVYTPAGFRRRGGRYPLLVVSDGAAYIQNIPMPVVLDNLISRGLIPPMVAVAVGNATGDSRATELTCSAPFADFLAKELVPWMRKKYGAGGDPAKTAVGGSSYGGLEAAFAALWHPEVFGNVLSQSGSFWWGPKDAPYSQWLGAQFDVSPKRNLRLFLDAGLMELSDDPTRAGVLSSNRELRQVLEKKGYAVRYDEFNGGHEYLNWRGNFADGVLYLFGGDVKQSGSER